MEEKRSIRSRRLVLSAPILITIIVTSSIVTIIMNNSKQSNPNSSGQDLTVIEDKEGLNEDVVEIKKPEASQEQIQTVLNSMSIDNKIGQLLFARVPEENALENISKYSLGGYILFGRDVEGQTFLEIHDKVISWQEAASSVGLFIGIDEEGGLVSRLSYAGLADFKSPRDLLGLDNDMLAVKNDTREKVSILDSIGVNVNFAPVADLCDDPDSFITSRTVGADPEFVSDYIKTVTKIYTRESDISATLKHFPGYGCNVDTHTGIAVDERTIEEYRTRDFLPFSAGIKAGADFVMISHNIISSIDSNNPASLSPEIHRILNMDLGFKGITITDDLSMDAITEYYHGEYPATVQAVLAGNNMLIVSDIESAFNEIKNAVSAGLINESRLDSILESVIKLKIEKGLITL